MGPALRTWPRGAGRRTAGVDTGKLAGYGLLGACALRPLPFFDPPDRDPNKSVTRVVMLHEPFDKYPHSLCDASVLALWNFPEIDHDPRDRVARA